MGVISPLLAVRDMKKTIEFYKNSLGFKLGMTFPDVDNPEYADLSKDVMVLMVIPAQDHGIDIRENLGIGVNIYMNIDGDIDEYYNELKSRNVKILRQINRCSVVMAKVRGWMYFVDTNNGNILGGLKLP